MLEDGPTISTREAGDVIVVEVEDDGIGGAELIAGRSLSGLDDRVIALGGLLELTEGPTGGTRLSARIPCG